MLNQLVKEFSEGKTSISDWSNEINEYFRKAGEELYNRVQEHGLKNTIKSLNFLIDEIDKCGTKLDDNKLNDLLWEMYDWPEKNGDKEKTKKGNKRHGVTTFIALSLLNVDKPGQFGIYDGKNTFKPIRYIFQSDSIKPETPNDDPNENYHTLKSYLSKIKDSLIEAGIKDANFLLVNIFLDWVINNKIKSKKKTK